MDGLVLQSTINNNHIRLDPRTKLLLLLVINIVLLSGGLGGWMIPVRLTLAGIPFILLLLSKKIKPSVIYLFAYLLSVYAENYLISSTSGIINIIILIPSTLVSRMLPGFIMGYFIINTTTVSEFVAAMEKMHISKKIIIPFSVMFRFFPTIGEECASINNAMRMRGIDLGNSRFFKSPISMIEYRMVPLMMCTVKIGDELSAASLTRGLGSPKKRTNICKIGFGIWDIFLMIISILAFLGYILL